MRNLGITLSVVVLGLSLVGTAQRAGMWPDEIVFFEEPDQAKVIAMMQTGDVHFYADSIDPNLLPQALGAGLVHATSHGSSVGVLLNYTGPLFSDGRFNPLALPKVREALNYLFDRSFVVGACVGTLATERVTVLDPNFPPYVEVLETTTAIEHEYTHDLTKATALIDAAMTSYGATKDSSGQWLYLDEPVALIGVVPVEDERQAVGQYIATQLPAVGFEVQLHYVTACEAVSTVYLSDPHDGLWSWYVEKQIPDAVDRDQAPSFGLQYTDRGPEIPLYTERVSYIDSGFDGVCARLETHNYDDEPTRQEALALAENLAIEDSFHVWLYNLNAPWMHPEGVTALADVAAGYLGTLWPYRIGFVDEDGDPIPGGTVRIAAPSLLCDVWNPLAESFLPYGKMIRRGTEALPTYPDPNTGLHMTNWIRRADVFVDEDLPVRWSQPWVDFSYKTKIEVPSDCWVDWDAKKQRFITAEEKFGDGLTALTKTIVSYTDDLFEHKWHDGSTLSLADMLIAFILRFDRAKPDSPIYDPSAVPRYEKLMASFRGARILSEDPVEIEIYSDDWGPEAENIAAERALYFWPSYTGGQAPWHTMAVAIRAEAAGRTAFSRPKADAQDIDQMDFVRGPSLQVLCEELGSVYMEGFVPYEPVLADHITEGDVVVRYANLSQWAARTGHLWIGLGPMQLYAVDPVAKILVGQRFADFPDPVDKWLAISAQQPPLLDPTVLGDVSRGSKATFEVQIADAYRNPYPHGDLVEVRYVVFDSTGGLVLSGNGALARDGLAVITLLPEDTAFLAPGWAQLKVYVEAKPTTKIANAVFEFLVI